MEQLIKKSALPGLFPTIVLAPAEDNLFDTDLATGHDDDATRKMERDLPNELPILPLRNTVLYPGVMFPITVARDKSIQLVKDAYKSEKRMIGVVAQREVENEDPNSDDLYPVGTAAAIVRMLRMPDGSVMIVIHGRARFQVESYTQQEPYFKARVKAYPEVYPEPDTGAAMMLNLKLEAARIIELNPNIPTEANVTLQNINSLAFLVHFIAANLNLEVAQKQHILELPQLLDKASIVLEMLAHELAVLEISEEIQNKVRTDMDRQQREFILRQQMKSIQDELGDTGLDAETEEFAKRAELKKWPEAVKQVFEKELNKLYRIHPSSPEYSVAMNYIEWLLDLPWQDYTQDRVDLAVARQILDTDHYGLQKVKERILEYLAVLKLKQNMKSPILCFYGPPGVGKTSLGRSIAKALGRKFVRMSLGGVRDESEVRGHRRTYIGSMPGRIIQGLKKSGSGNPVFLLDEIDKVGTDFRGDPSSALLEVLDPEQNSTFSDHYIDLDYDLSPVLFIATANSLDTIQPALRDRMEIIEINGYTLEEKVEIARNHLIPKVLDDHGLKRRQLKFADEAIIRIIDRYTRESGVRELGRKLGDVCRGVAARIVEAKFKSITISPEKLEGFLGIHRYESEAYQMVDRPGVSVGLAWTPVGGEILFFETLLTRGRGHISLTGSLGDVMKESAQLAHTWLRSQAAHYRIAPSGFDGWDLHLHVPAGAVPKDGPSAGIAILSAIASVFSQRRVKPHVGMTGEITLRGRVLPVGGIKEKVLAAKRAGLTTLILPRDNEKDVREIKPTHLVEGLRFHYVTEMAQVLDLALEPTTVENPLDVVARNAEGLGFIKPRFDNPMA